MTKTTNTPDKRQQAQSELQPGFRPVALPALKAAVHASRQKPEPKNKAHEPPAILRDKSQLG